MMMAAIAVGLGAALGAVARWLLSLAMNGMHAFIPCGTLAANCIGAFVIGIATAFFLSHPTLNPQVRLFAVTGFLGGLTTFSTFSAETVSLLQRGEFMWAGAQILLHVGLSILLCFAGFALYGLFQR